MNLIALDAYLTRLGLARRTKELYLRIAERRIGTTHPVTWFAAEIAREQPLNTLLPLRATAKHVLVACYGMTAQNAASALPVARGRTSARKEGLTDDQLVRYRTALDAAPEPVRSLLLLLPWTGLRISAACATRWEDIQARGDVVVLVVRSGKGNKEREVPLGRTAREILRVLRTGSDLGPFIFKGRRGPVSTDYVRKVLARFVRSQTGLSNVTPHTLRHTYATRLVARGANLSNVQHALGHASITSTQRYLHPTTAQIAADVDRLED
jgi:integrase